MEFGPFESSAIESFPTRAGWDATAAEIVARMLERWHLAAGEAFVGGASAAVLRVSRADGSPAVLKVGYPHVEAIWEAVGLEAAGSELAPELLRQDAWTWSLLMEDVWPGVPLSRDPMAACDALAVGAELLRRLHVRDIPAGIPTLASAMEDYASNARARLPDQAAALDALAVLPLVERALALVEDLIGSSPDPVLLHGDFNPGNILFDASRDRWVMIDSKPLAGDPAFDLWPLASQLGTDRLVGLQVAAQAAGIDIDRAARWSFARSAMNVTWYLADGLPEEASVEAVALQEWSALVGG